MLSFKLLGVQGLLLSPPVDNPRNVIDFSLYVTHYKVRPAAGTQPPLLTYSKWTVACAP